ncbi:MAG: GNAT family N-acetyltransferase [Rhodocyclaceae bacterium]|nr:GNAT family N-acetyltransferase [Rhodocyclaceae bacterium]
MDVNIEFAGGADIPAMAALLQELFAREADFQPDLAKQCAGLRLILDQPERGRLFVLRAEGRVIGMANALTLVSTAEGAPVLLLEDLILAAEWRGRGLGRRLVEHICAWAAAQGMTRVTLLTGHDNHAAQAFYAAAGFRPSAMRVMRRALG